MDGIVAARTIRSLPGSAGLVPMIGLSANISENDRTACLDAGMNLFLTKPVTLDRLAGALSLVMARAGAESLQ
jgi:CheY-like chemotaxis protein